MSKDLNKERKVTVRYNDEQEQILTRLMRKYNISKSECFRQGIYLYEEPNKYDMLPSLCGISSVVNEMLERGNFNEEDKKYFQQEVNEIWQQLL